MSLWDELDRDGRVRVMRGAIAAGESVEAFAKRVGSFPSVVRFVADARGLDWTVPPAAPPSYPAPKLVPSIRPDGGEPCQDAAGPLPRGSLQARIAELLQENERLRAEIAWLRERDADIRPLPFCLNLTATEERLVQGLLRRELATREHLLEAMSDDSGWDRPEIKIVDVVICKARKKLAPFGVVIETHWGRGYSIPRAGRAVLDALRAEAAA